MYGVKNRLSFRAGSHPFWCRLDTVGRGWGNGLGFTFPAYKVGIMVSAPPNPQTFCHDLGEAEEWGETGVGRGEDKGNGKLSQPPLVLKPKLSN